jgi:transposase
LALVTVLQYVEGLSDRQAADAVRGRIDWKYALGLALTDSGFDASVLSEFRTRLVQGQAERLLFDALLARFRAAKLLKARGRQRTDSTHVLAAVRTLNRLEGAGETLRQALNVLAVAAPDWLRATCAEAHPDWPERYGPRVSDFRLPTRPDERAALAAAIGRDGVALLRAVHAPEAPAWLRAVPAVETLRRVWVQQYYLDDAGVHWRTDEQVPPAAVAVRSPYDPDARFAKKRTVFWLGYKAHLTETCEPVLPHLVTHVETTAAPVPDAVVTGAVHAGLRADDLLPGIHLVDTGYVDGGLIVASREEYGVDLIGPPLPDSGWQARAGNGFGASAFAVDWAGQRVTCPEGKTSVSWSPATDRHGNAVVKVKFARSDCGDCASRPSCTRNPERRRTVTLKPDAEYRALQAARGRQTTAAFAGEYARRAGIEGTISQGVRAFGLRRCRYVGHAKTHLQHLLTAAALNFARVADWIADHSPATTRRSAFEKLMAKPALG